MPENLAHQARQHFQSSCWEAEVQPRIELLADRYTQIAGMGDGADVSGDDRDIRDTAPAEEPKSVEEIVVIEQQQSGVRVIISTPLFLIGR